jgi:putative hydrolase of the HAD superfamily
MAPVLGVIFDRDGVLMTFDRMRLARDVLSRIPLPEAEITARWRAWLEGAALRDARDEAEQIGGFLTNLAAELDIDPAERASLARVDYLTCVRGFDDAKPALLEAKRRGLRVAVLTNNTISLSATRPLAAAGLDGLVDVALSSQMVGARKPEARAYEAVAAALGLPAKRCLFFDNTPACVAGARAVGMGAWHVDRSRECHDLDAGVVRDLTALPLVLDRRARS